jgi:glycosyltransferase involved in cell wall biosynthesis
MLLFYIFCICLLIQTFFAVWMLWSAPSFKESSQNLDTEEPLSIIICAHNEAENLKLNLPYILDQSHQNFEVIIVNDASEDNTLEIIEELKRKHLHLRVVSIAKEEVRTFPGKKFALSKGIAEAQYDNLLLCDADCKPMSPNWASIMASKLNGVYEIIAGFGAYQYERGFLNAFIRWETLHTFLQYSSYAKRGLPYMAVGRNLACKKNILLKAQSHPYWSLTPSGDDDLLVRLMGNKHNYAIVADTNAHTISEAKSTFKDWIAQKQRHLSTGKLYKREIQFLLGTYGFSHGLMWLLVIILWIGGMAYLISSLFILRCMLTWSLWAITTENLNQKKMIFWLPICDISWAIYNLFLSPYIFFKTKLKWK